MKSIDVYRYIVNNREKGGDSSDTVSPQKSKSEPPIILPESFFKSANIRPEYIDDWAEREAILVIDGGLSPDKAFGS